MPHSSHNGPNRRALAIAISTALAAGGLEAQETTDPAVQGRSTETVIVTGRPFQNSLINRLEISPDEFPYSLEVIDEEALHERGFFNPLDVLETVPNVVRRNTQYLPTGGSYTIRGLYGTVLTNNRPENDSRGSGRRDSSQIQRIEVLKGPVSVLLGPIIPGGVVNQVTKSPEADSFAEFIGRAGSFGTYRAEADLNQGNLFGSDVWSGRLTVAIEDQKSPQDEANTKTTAVRPVIEANFTDRTRIQASVALAEREGTPSSAFALYSDGTIPEGIEDDTYFGVPSTQTGDDVYLDFELQHQFLDDLKLVVRGSQQDTDFDYQTSQSSYNYAGGRGFGPGDTDAYVYYSLGFRDTEVDYTDLQLVGGFDAFGQRSDWVIGTSTQDTTFASYWAYGGVLGVVDINDIPSATYGVPDFNLELLTPYRDLEDELSSIYAEVNFRPSERLTIVTGMRHDDYEVLNLTSNEITPTDETTFRIGGTYEFANGLNGYISHAESFYPQTGVMSDGSLIEPETATNYEIGLKGSLLDGRLGLTAAVFALTRENVATADPNNAPGGPYYVVATGEQEHNGFEISANIRISPALNLDLAYGNVDTEVTRVIAAGSGQDVGDPVSMSPESTHSAFLSYTLQDGSMRGLSLGLGMRGISDRYSTQYDINYGGYTLVDASLSYALSENLDVQLNIHNLTDDEYLDTAGFSTGSPGGGSRFGNPRSAYVTVRTRF